MHVDEAPAEVNPLVEHGHDDGDVALVGSPSGVGIVHDPAVTGTEITALRGELADHARPE